MLARASSTENRRTETQCGPGASQLSRSNADQRHTHHQCDGESGRKEVTPHSRTSLPELGFVAVGVAHSIFRGSASDRCRQSAHLRRPFGACHTMSTFSYA